MGKCSYGIWRTKQIFSVICEHRFLLGVMKLHNTVNIELYLLMDGFYMKNSVMNLYIDSVDNGP